MKDEEYAQALSRPSLTDLEASVALALVAALVDAAWDRRDLTGIDHALRLGEELLAPARRKDLAREGLAYLHYCLANAWDGKEHLAPDAHERAWDWQSEASERKVFHLRTALNDGGANWDAALRSRALTNLANAFDGLGRFVEAIELYDLARALAPDYGMPSANRGLALKAYAQCVSDPGHARFLLHYAVQSMESALDLPLDSEAVRSQVSEVLAMSRKALGDWTPEAHAWSLGKTNAERAYRKWALRERLFLNPLNDLGELPIAAHDPLCPLSIATKAGEGPSFFGFLNSMKQEYASARFLLFQGFHRRGPHFSDRGVKIVNTLDYPVHRLGMEEVKIAFRLAYSLWDKVAAFLNQYFQIGLAANAVYFRTVWFEKPREGVLRAAFSGRANWPLRGLFWISKDLFERRDDHRSVQAPDARELADLRHQLEHRHLRVLEWADADGEPADAIQDADARAIAQDVLQRKALRILKLIRASLMHLVYAVTAEERARARQQGGKVAMPLFLQPVRDEWKC